MTAVAMPRPAPYGAAELKVVARKYLSEGAAVAALLVALISLATTQFLKYQQLQASRHMRMVVIPWHQLPAPPSLSAAPMQVAQVNSPAPPSIGIPVPVPDEVAPTETKLASLKEIQQATPTASTLPGGGDNIVIEAPPEDVLPPPGGYVYRDDEPVLVHSVDPKYPELARQSNIEGRVLLNVLIWTDGSVRKAEVVSGEPLFAQAAIEAVMKFKFRPALANNRPVAVWVAIPIKFQLTQS